MGEKKSQGHKSVGVIIKSKDTEKILLLKRSNAHHKFAGHWSIPAGGVEEGENNIQALKRETLEETGITNLSNINYLISLVNPKKKEEFDIYTAQISNEIPPQLDFEHTTFKWHGKNDLLPEPLGKEMYRILKQQT